MPSNKKRQGKYGTRTGASTPPATRKPSDPAPPQQERRGAASASPVAAPQSNRTVTAIRAVVPALAENAQRNAYFELYSAACYRASKASSEATTEHFNRICEIRIGNAYRRVYERWKRLWSAAQCAELAFSNRLLIGLSNPSLWESSVTLNPTYGTPVIPGSACKGLARHFAESHLHLADNNSGLTRDLSNALFGQADDAGEVCFQDAWWVPNSAPALYDQDRPFVREVVTPHHKDFLDRSGGVEATPFDSPVPVPQIAAHGRFLFVVTGSAVWAAHALDILRLALSMEGIGARTPEYGRAESGQSTGGAK